MQISNDTDNISRNKDIILVKQDKRLHRKCINILDSKQFKKTPQKD